jgi:hypothetical protein
MSENEGGESRTTVAFFLGFLLGVALTLGGGGTFFMVHVQRTREEAVMQRHLAEEAMMQAEEARRREAAERVKAEKALREGRKGKGERAAD